MTGSTQTMPGQGGYPSRRAQTISPGPGPPNADAEAEAAEAPFLEDFSFSSGEEPLSFEVLAVLPLGVLLLLALFPLLLLLLAPLPLLLLALSLVSDLFLGVGGFGDLEKKLRRETCCFFSIFLVRSMGRTSNDDS